VPNLIEPEAGPASLDVYGLGQPDIKAGDEIRVMCFEKEELPEIARGHISLYTLFVILDSGVNTILIQRTIERQELRSGVVRGVRISMRTRRPTPLNRIWKKSRASFSLGTPVVFVRGVIAREASILHHRYPKNLAPRVDVR